MLHFTSRKKGSALMKACQRPGINLKQPGRPGLKSPRQNPRELSKHLLPFLALGDKGKLFITSSLLTWQLSLLRPPSLGSDQCFLQLEVLPPMLLYPITLHETMSPVSSLDQWDGKSLECEPKQEPANGQGLLAITLCTTHLYPSSHQDSGLLHSHPHLPYLPGTLK